MRLALAASLLITSSLFAADPFEGIWKLNVEKSKLLPTTDLASETMKIVSSGPNSFKTTIDLTTKSGQARHQETDRVMDGKEYKTGQNTSEIAERVNGSTRRIVGKQDGRQDVEIMSTITGKTMTNHRKTNRGEETLVFGKQ